MAKLLLQDVKVTINGTNLSNAIKSVELSLSSDAKDVTAFGDGWINRISGLKDGSVKIDFFQDFGASAVEATVFPLFGTLATVVVLPTSGTASVTNPSYTFLALVNAHMPVAGAVGDVATLSVTWPTSGTVTKATA
jgi:hypothetical protein